ncbi:cysteine-tryptophan domain-containing zinc finger protein 7-like [Nymphaea colorata]|nr:cysteine-tryptophan domain-containing zinc finger protein 7-like [Nymphaea colorata]XP_031496675.1 cysteine-tryptophan domain-containing zinc finger protein 7-like [Nymphaea colorata]XP_031496676.1 cysteine-tryptophan domain-containing zinc finger protein 7-like [Nymphaea colorata]XP_049935882.1 cysteine-tryptophan domain-containing zinc finger protein 7-like [Nymphaea colorata]
MLSLRSRDEDREFRKRRRKGLGFERMGEMEDNEIEEGEACSYRDDNSSIHGPDVDVDLSYIDEKIQDVLGHFQKDFEGGLSLENLGSKFGGYGSFLPSYQRSPPILSNSRNPGKVQHANTPSHVDQSLEATRQNIKHQTDASVLVRSAPAPANVQMAASVTSLVASTHKDFGMNITMHNAQDSTPKCEPDFKPSNQNGQKSLKVRIKVPSENVYARNNEAIYSGLGLDISPSTSLEDSSDDSGGLSIKTREAPDESPNSILQVMTSFPLVDGLLLSPLSDVLLSLMERGKPLHEESRSEAVRKSVSGRDTECVVSSSGRNSKGHKGKTKVALRQAGELEEVKHVNPTAEEKGVAAMLKKEVDIETPEGKEIVLNALKLPLLAVGEDDSCEELDKYSDLDVGKATCKLPDVLKEQGEITLSNPMKKEARESTRHMGMMKDGNTVNEMLLMKGKLMLKTNLAGRAWEEQNDNLEMGRDDKATIDPRFHVSNDFTPGKKSSNSLSEYPNQKMNERKTLIAQTDDRKKQEGKNHLVVEKKKRKDSQSNIKSASDPSKERPMSASGSVKHKKKHMHARNGLETPHDMVRSQESNKRTDKDCHKDTTGHVGIEHLKSRVDSLDSFGKDNVGVLKAKDIQRGSDQHFEEQNDGLNAKILENASSSNLNVLGSVPPIASNGLLSDTAATAAAPIVIEEYWVCCDKCQKWRLHPFGPDPTCLPKKWLCSMQHWLPGLNKCTVSEEETNKAFYVFYQLQDHQNSLHTQNFGSVPGVNLGDGQNPGSTLFKCSASSTTGKKKFMVKDTNNGSNLTTFVSFSNSTKKNQQTPIKSINDVNRYPSDSNTSNKETMQYVVKSHEHDGNKQRHKQNEKHKSLKGYSNEGDYVELDMDPKFKDMKEPEQDNHRSSKKVKVDGSRTDEEWDSRNVQSDKDEISTKVASTNVQKFDKDETSTKKRKMKQWQASQVLPEGIVNKENFSDSRLLAKDVTHEMEKKREKKAKSSKFEERESSTRSSDVRVEKKGKVMQIVPNNSEDPLLDGTCEGSWGRNVKEHQPAKFQANAVSKRISEGVNSLKQDIGYMQQSSAATSSSSKVSGSCKSKTNLQEVKGSPVESVSSSPLRMSSVDRVASRKNFSGKDDMTNVGPFVGGSPRRCSDGEAVSGSNRSRITSKEKNSVLGEHVMQNGGKSSRSLVLDSGRVACDNHSGDLKKSKYGLKTSADAGNNHVVDGTDVIGQQNHGLNELKNKEDSSERKNCDAANGSFQGKSGKGSSSRAREKQGGTKSDTKKGKCKDLISFDEDHGQFASTNSVVGKSKTVRSKDGRPALQQTSQQPTAWEDEKMLGPPHLSKTDTADLVSVRGRSQTFPSSQEPPRANSSSHKVGNTGACSVDASNGGTSKVPNQMDNPRLAKGAGLRHAATNDIVVRELDVRSPVRKESGQTALREAKDLKHTADRLMNGGQELESFGLYFRSALKFLHSASLLEPNDTEGIKPGDNHSVQIYNDTAKLCEFCAHAFERYKDMAAAALAYKCMEVAYMRVVFLKQSYINRIRHEVLSVLPSVPGESPSSSASDIDNLNNHVMSDKTISLKRVGSPQRPSSLVISARNRRSFDWLLNFANDVHLAMDALRRSHNALSIANGSSGFARCGPEGISSARKVVDFNFHDVEGFLNLVRHAMEEISC